MRLIYKEKRKVEALLASEKGGIRKRFGAHYSVAAVFPNSYFLGMSNLGFQFLYDRINSHPDWLCHRGFLAPLPGHTLEEKRQLTEYNVVAFSMSYELDFCWLLTILEKAGIEPYSRKRDEQQPLLIAGGTAVTLNPLAILDFVDICVLGDGEGMLELILDVYKEYKGDKEAICRSLAHYPGLLSSRDDLGRFWSDDGPNQANKVAEKLKRPHVIANLDAQPVASEIVAPETEFANACLIELSRGCPHRCAFCWIGHQPAPFRVLSLSKLIETVQEKRALTSRFGFVSSAVGDYPYLGELCQFCNKEELEISFSSLRPEAITPEMLSSLVRSGQKTLTIALETGNDRLRKKIGKDFSNEYLKEKIALALETGMKNIKLYFLIGLPEESSEDIESIGVLLRELQSIQVKYAARKRVMGTITANMGIFTPRPGTPLASYTMPEIRKLQKKLRRLRQILQALPNVEFTLASPYEAIAQWRLASDRQKARELVLLAHNHQGNWKAALRAFMTGAATLRRDVSNKL